MSNEKLTKQMLLVSRLYNKIDYIKSYRVRIPVFVGIGNVGLTSIFGSFIENTDTKFVIAASMLIIGILGGYALHIIRKSFSENVDELEHIYTKMDMKTEEFMQNPDDSLADDAGPIWILLFLLISIATLLPIWVLLVGIIVPN